MAKNIGIIYCERIQDTSCIGCAKCYKAVNENTFAFEDAGDVNVVFKCSCGDCPGLVVPKVGLQMTVLKDIDVKVDEIYFGTCVQKATALMNCPMNIDGVTEVMKNKFGVPVHLGTHDY